MSCNKLFEKMYIKCSNWYLIDKNIKKSLLCIPLTAKYTANESN